MTRATGPRLRSSHVRRTAAAQLISVEDDYRAPVDADVAKNRKTTQRAVDVLTGGPHHRCQRALVEGHVDAGAVRCRPAFRVRELHQLRGDAARNVQESDLAHGGVLALDVDAQAGNDPQQE